MKKISVLNRLILVGAGHLAGYQIVAGIEGLDFLPTLAYTVAFGVMVLACLLILTLGYRALDNTGVVIVATLIPLGLSNGMVSQYSPGIAPVYLLFSIIGFALVIGTKLVRPGRVSTSIVTTVHGLAGLTVTLLPIGLSLGGVTPPAYALVSAGGMLVGAMGLMLAFERFGRPWVPRERLYLILPALLLVINALFVIGMRAARL
ncbi:hypothetical protein ACFL2Z_01325 [Candidatus Eisenbacteria bacterium]|uniref:Permease n=1 Tax=Eiseniibacteriota bacterium TaxID=2212470 RepID=A0ABV6YN92_UNCEI